MASTATTTNNTTRRAQGMSALPRGCTMPTRAKVTRTVMCVPSSPSDIIAQVSVCRFYVSVYVRLHMGFDWVVITIVKTK